MNKNRKLLNFFISWKIWNSLMKFRLKIFMAKNCYYWILLFETIPSIFEAYTTMWYSAPASRLSNINSGASELLKLYTSLKRASDLYTSQWKVGKWPPSKPDWHAASILSQVTFRGWQYLGGSGADSRTISYLKIKI